MEEFNKEILELIESCEIDNAQANQLRWEAQEKIKNGIKPGINEDFF